MTGGGAVPLIWGRLEPPASRATASPGDAGAGSRRDPQAAHHGRQPACFATPRIEPEGAGLGTF